MISGEKTEDVAYFSLTDYGGNLEHSSLFLKEDVSAFRIDLPGEDLIFDFSGEISALWVKWKKLSEENIFFLTVELCGCMSAQLLSPV